MTPIVLLLAFASAQPANSPAPAGPSPDYGPFFAAEAPGETEFPSGPKTGAPPRFSVGKGAFCFVEDSQCRAALLASVDIGIGVNAIAGDRGVDLPYAHYNFRGGMTFRPVTLIRKRWHPWALGAMVSWSRGTGVVANAGSTADPESTSLKSTPHTTSLRFGVVNQLWLSQRRNAFHIDLTVGLVRSSVLAYNGVYSGTHLELAGGWGGWGSFFVSSDFLYGDTRLVAGFRGHGMAVAPAVGLILLGLLAGGAL